MDLTREAIEAMAHGDAIRAARCAIEEDAKAVALPDGFTLHDLERFGSMRRRMRGEMHTSSASDFAAYVAWQQQVGWAAIFVDPSAMSATAVLNLGYPEHPGHADNTATFAPKRTAAHLAMSQATSSPLTQREFAEFLEDWPRECSCWRDGVPIDLGQAIAAIRLVTVDVASRITTEERSLSASRSALQSAKVDGPANNLPSNITFFCEPYLGFAARDFVLRVSVRTSEKAPTFWLHVAKPEQHEQELGQELAAIVRGACGATPVYVGAYTALT